MSRPRSICFTLNNWTQEEYDNINKLTNVKYSIIGKEVGESGTPHLQGYIQFKSSKTFNVIARAIPRAHISVAKGTAAQNRVYCSKGGDFVEVGDCPPDPKECGEGEKVRWDRILTLAKEGDMETLDKEFPKESVMYHRQLLAKRKWSVAELDGEMPHQWYVGETGAGKSRKARDENPGAYIKDPQTVWWDGYDGEAVVIIDDFDKFQVRQGGDMKRWLDRYPFQAQTKGGQKTIRPAKIVVTSQYRPEEIWEDQKTVEAIRRRVTVTDFNLFPHIPRRTTEEEEEYQRLFDGN